MFKQHFVTKPRTASERSVTAQRFRSVQECAVMRTNTLRWHSAWGDD
jgi:hypothetical protein